MKTGTFKDLFDYITKGMEDPAPAKIVAALSVEALSYEDTPCRLYNDTVRFRRLNQGARLAVATRYLAGKCL
jgi:hypothetical protein